MVPKPTVATMYEFSDEEDDHVALNLSSQQLQKEQEDYLQQQQGSSDGVVSCSGSFLIHSLNI